MFCGGSGLSFPHFIPSRYFLARYRKLLFQGTAGILITCNTFAMALRRSKAGHGNDIKTRLFLSFAKARWSSSCVFSLHCKRSGSILPPSSPKNRTVPTLYHDYIRCILNKLWYGFSSNSYINSRCFIKLSSKSPQVRRVGLPAPGGVISPKILERLSSFCERDFAPLFRRSRCRTRRGGFT